MFIRTTDTATLYKLHTKNNTFLPFQFINGRRKNNIIKQFIVDENDQIKYIHTVLETRMIPKKERYLFFGKPINVVITSENVLIYQDVDESPCRFVTIDEVSDCIIPIDICDIIPNETEILCYDGVDDFYFTTIISLSQYIYNVIQPENDIYNQQYIKQYNQLSNYFIYAPHGIIINNFFLI